MTDDPFSPRGAERWAALMERLNAGGFRDPDGTPDPPPRPPAPPLSHETTPFGPASETDPITGLPDGYVFSDRGHVDRDPYWW